MEINDIEELNEALDNNIYDVKHVSLKILKPDTVIDENKSVRWNIDEVYRLNKESQEAVEDYRSKRRIMDLKLDEDIIRVYSNISKYSKGKIEVLYNYAYEQSHSSGMYEVLQTLEELIEVLQRVDEKD